jgi:hypothetical protein
MVGGTSGREDSTPGRVAEDGGSEELESGRRVEEE